MSGLSLSTFLTPFMKTLATVPETRKLTMEKMIPAIGKICQNVAPVPMSAVVIPRDAIRSICLYVLSLGSYSSFSARKPITVVPASEGMAMAKQRMAMIPAGSSCPMPMKPCKMRRLIAVSPLVYRYLTLPNFSNFSMLFSSQSCTQSFFVGRFSLFTLKRKGKGGEEDGQFAESSAFL